LSEYVLQMKDIIKEYSGNRVLHGVELSLKPGEIHALIGENGAGKSTLMNILFGMPRIYNSGGFSGDVYFEGEKVDVKTPKEAMELGIGMVHQEFMLIPSFTISENIKLNRENLKHNVVSKVLGTNLKTVDFEKMNSDSRRSLDEIDVSIEEYIKIEGLPVGYMQFVEIAREVDKSNVKVLVFDEPTAVLAESEAQSLLKTMRKLADKGIAILFISHRLDEVIDVCDNASILRDGELVAAKAIKDTNVVELAELMVGRKIEMVQKKKKYEEQSEPILKVKDLHVDMPGEQVKGINLEIKKGEILGIAGLAGQGKIGVANGIMGFYPATGEIVYQGKILELNDTANALSKGLAFVSEDRKGVGLILDASIELNIAFTALEVQERFLKKILFFKMQYGKSIRKHAQQMIRDLDIRCRSAHQNVGSLSGGNQQKVCVARALTQEPNLMFISEPTRGIDIGAKKLVLDLLVELNRELNMTIVLTSSELAEVRSISDRIIIISDGKIAGELQPDDADVEFGLLMSGKSLEKEEAINE